MRVVAVVALQILVSLLVTGAVLPLVLLGVPSARDRWVGSALLYGLPIAMFLLLRVVWPKPKS